MNTQSNTNAEFLTALGSLAGAVAILVSAPVAKGAPAAVLVLSAAYAYTRYRQVEVAHRDRRLVVSAVVAVSAGLVFLVALATGAGSEPNATNAARRNATASPSVTQTPSSTDEPALTATPMSSSTPAVSPTPTMNANVRVKVPQGTRASVFGGRLRITVRATEYDELDGGLQDFITRLVVRASGVDCTEWTVVAAGDVFVVRAAQTRYTIDVVNVDTFDATFDVRRAAAKRRSNEAECARS
ncbi:hypothetical protein DVA67_020500 [Solirubrobacter sp. CPCC 204708]|uniref:Uncharacterized protein n=1 Tax=Solirubrobacter deserti TaxID=2282478 RepID=A0ABT4RP76_9ACTN|nr:hypothetical protein [Solirubrobacter deserti]MBE2318374.1 hypothetical protein [Solirubrobacter deserti]MDA0140106.1 hypothetical protein [Solirubrobacter deserti]